eukprot:scaffold5779_cov205-Skeletonema_dohrnii-CCMP3373.AAC.4
MDPSLPKSKRGAFQPRGDLQNRSPEDEDVSDDDQQLKSSSHSNPPLPPSNKSTNTTKKKKKAEYLPVKSSGYGRASPSVKLSASSSRPKLRHGDGSLAGELARDKKKSRSSISSRSSLLSVHTTNAATAMNNNINSGKSRSRSASPAMRSMRSRTSPAVTKSQKEQQHRELNKNKRQYVVDNRKFDGVPMKKQKNQETFRSKAEEVISSNKSFASLESSNNHHNARKKYDQFDGIPVDKPKNQENFSSSKGSAFSEVASSKSFASLPNRAAVREPTPLSPLIPVMEEEKVDCEVAMTDADPSALALFVQQQSTDSSTSTHVGSNETVACIFTDLHPNISQTQSLSDNLFSIQSGIASTSILSLIKNKKKSTPAAAAVDRSTPSELRKRLERKDEELKTLKIVCNDLLQGKDEFVSGAIGIELALRQKIMGVQTAFGLLGQEKETLMKQLNDANDTALKMQEEMECLRRERDLATAKCDALQEDCDGAKSNHDTLQQSYNESCVKMALLETKVEESKSQLEEARSQVVEAQLSKEKALDEMKVEMSKDMNALQEQNETMVASVKAREMEICRILSVDLESVDFGDGSSLLNAVRSKVEDYQHDANTTKEIEIELERLKAELTQSKTDLGCALERAATKDKDMSELMKIISDIQRTAQDREQGVHQLRKDAENRALESEKTVLSLNVEKQSLEKSLEETKAQCATHENTIQELQQHLSESKIESTQFTSQLQLERDLRARSEEKEKEEHNERVALSAQMLAMTKEHSQVETQMRGDMEKLEVTWSEKHAAAVRESAEKDEKLNECREEITSLIAKQASLKQALSEQKTALDASKEEEIGRLKGEITVLQEKLKLEAENLESVGIVSAQRVRELEETVRKSENERKRMHNIIQELRGNVRVFARIRPFLPNENDNNVPFVTPSGETTLQVVRGRQENSFQFDRVFAPSAGQEAVFDEVSEFVQSALDGYNVCLFSYGQTGSGKTHTMQGAGSGVMRGLIPRSIEQIGLHKKKLELEGWEFTMDISFLEIYNEAIRDLLRDAKSNESKHDIKVDSNGHRTVTNLNVKRIDPTDADCCDDLLSLAAKRRSTASTDMNAVSSRSHSVFTLNMTATHVEKNKLIRGTLNLVDLAGSERLDRSNATGQTAKEAMAINKSLSSLTDVFAAIGEKSSHVPFRNSKLTYLLQPCFSGDGKTLMVVNISPTEESVQESMCSLRFASHVNKCELGKAKRTCTKVR